MDPWGWSKDVYSWLDTKQTPYGNADAAWSGWVQEHPITFILPDSFKEWWNTWNAKKQSTTLPKQPPIPQITDYVQWEYKTVWNPDTGVPETWRRKAGYNYGKPMPAGAWEKDPTAKDWTDTYGEIKGMPGEMEKRGLSSFNDWMTSQEYTMGDTGNQMSALETLRTQLMNGPTDEDYGAGWDRAAQGLGVTGDELTAMLGNLTNQMAGGISGQEGLSADEMALRERAKRSALKETEQYTSKMLDNVLASSGSRGRYLSQGDEALQAISDQQLKYDLSIQQEDADRRQQEYEAKSKTWAAMWQAGQMTQQQFLENIRQDRSLALQTTATEISAIMQKNQQYLQMYGADLQAFELYANTVFNSINAEMGLDQHVLDMTSELYNQALAPYAAALVEYDKQFAAYQQDYAEFWNAQILDQQTQQNNQTQTTAIITGVLGFVGTIVGSILGAPWLGAVLAGGAKVVSAATQQNPTGGTTTYDYLGNPTGGTTYDYLGNLA